MDDAAPQSSEPSSSGPDWESAPLPVLIGIAIAVCVCAAVVVYMRRGSSAHKLAATNMAAPAAASSASTGASAPVSNAAAPDARSATAKSSADADAASQLVPLDIYYGTQTGTAEAFAKSLAKESRNHGFKGTAIDLSKFTPARVSSGWALFLLATYGEGDPTDNAVEFTRWLGAKHEGEAPLAGLRFSVFGLGNKQYEHYNKMGRVTHARLLELGAVCVHPHGEGDDDGCMDEDMGRWRDGLWTDLRAAVEAEDAKGSGGGAATDGAPNGHGAAAAPTLKRFASLKSVETPTMERPRLPWTLVPLPEAPRAPRAVTSDSLAAAEHSSKHFFVTAAPAYEVSVADVRELRAVTGVGASTRHVELDIAGSALEGYHTADNLYILPQNDPEVVASVASWFGLDLDAWFDLQRAPDADAEDASAPLPFPSPLSVRTLLTEYLDLACAPRRDLLAALATYAADAQDAALLRRLASPTERTEYHAVVIDLKLAVHELFRMFPSLKLPLDAFAQLLPRLQPRAYTVSSSALVHPNRIAVTVSVIDEPKPSPLDALPAWSAALARLPARRRLQGVCTNFVARLSRGSRMRAYVHASTFRLPSDPSLPVVCIGPGTGFAPMRAFLHERQALRRSGAPVGRTLVYFGCRNRDEDYIYRDEIEGFVRDGTISHLQLAFSRETSSKVYVQHKVAEDATLLHDVLTREGGFVYVCGGTRMGHDVAATFAEKVFGAAGGLSPVAAAAALKALQDAVPRRYTQELWTASA